MIYRIRYCSSIALLAASAITLPLNQKPSAPRETVWFVLLELPGSNGELMLDPIATSSEGKLSAVPDACTPDDPAFQKFSAEYLNAGHSYSVVFGGSSAGNAVVRASAKGPVSVVEYVGSARIHGQLMALATNVAASHTGAASRQPPTGAERQTALDLAKKLFAKAGVAPNLLNKLKVENLTHTLLLPSRSPSLIGSFSIKAGGDRGPTHNLFFIATLHETGYTPELVWTKISNDELENQRATLVDQGDLSGDGEEEVIVLERGYEGYVYRIYRRTKNDASHWEPIFEAAVGDC